MANYIDIDGKKWVQLDDGALVPATAILALDGGFPIRLIQSQLDSLKAPTFPSSFPIPSAQVADLKVVAIANFPSAFAASNLPAQYPIANWPSTFPWTAQEEQVVFDLKAFVTGLDVGSGLITAKTLRTTMATDAVVKVSQETANMSAVSFSTSGDQTIITPAANKALRISEICLTAASLVAVRFREGTTVQGQTNLSGAFSVIDYVSSFSRAIALAANKSFVINSASAVAINGYVCWWEV